MSNDSLMTAHVKVQRLWNMHVLTGKVVKPGKVAVNQVKGRELPLQATEPN